MKLRIWLAFFVMTIGAFIIGAGSVYLGSRAFWASDNLWSATGTAAAVWILGTVASGFACAKLLRVWQRPVLGVAMIFAIFAALPFAWALSRYIYNTWMNYPTMYAICALLFCAGQTGAIQRKSRKRGDSMKTTLHLDNPSVAR